MWGFWDMMLCWYNHQVGGQDWASTEQHDQGRWPFLEQVMETCNYTLPEGINHIPPWECTDSRVMAYFQTLLAQAVLCHNLISWVCYLQSLQFTSKCCPSSCIPTIASSSHCFIQLSVPLVVSTHDSIHPTIPPFLFAYYSFCSTHQPNQFCQQLVFLGLC